MEICMPQPTNKTNKQKDDTFLDESFDTYNSASSTDCTGLIFAAPQSDEDWDAYDEVYHFQPISVKKEKE